MSYPLIISLHSARMKCSFSGVRMHSEFFWPVLDSPSMTSEHWFILIVPCGRVLGCRTQQRRQINKVLTDVPAPHIRPHGSVFSHYPPQHQFSCQAWHATHWHSLHSQMFLLGLSVIFLFLVIFIGAFQRLLLHNCIICAAFYFFYSSCTRKSHYSNNWGAFQPGN